MLQRSGPEFRPLIDSPEALVAQWENDRSLLAPAELQRRMEVLDRLDACFPDLDANGTNLDLSGSPPRARARALAARLEAVNAVLCESIRGEIRQGRCPASLMQILEQGTLNSEGSRCVRGMAYDYLDELICGVLRLDPPKEELPRRDPDMVFYQPTPARHIFRLIARAAISPNDVLIDLGSGLGHVPLLVSACTGARTIGIELEPGYVACAKRCAESLNLVRVRFLAQDAREADFASGTAFYLYTPFTGTMLRSVMDSLRRQAAVRPIRIATYGPVTAAFTQETWLRARMPPEPDRITVFVGEP